MRVLEFANPIFHEGMNLTVRKGIKWRNSDGIVLLADTEGQEVGMARVHVTITKKFSAVCDDELKYEHDPFCRTKLGLMEVLAKMYGEITRWDEVTLVFFEPL